jgi:5,6-dimethylbenzimidazole synthase
MVSPQFDDAFHRSLEQLFIWRRDVRRFRRDALEPELIERLLRLACLAPSVGNAQPWRFVLVEDAGRRARVRESFLACNRRALAEHEGERARLYASLKLEGLDVAPVQMAVFCDLGAETGFGLGRRTMPETMEYSVVSAIQTFWLAARAFGIGVGWVSILDPGVVTAGLAVPADWKLVAYLCVGYPEQELADPELVRVGWQDRLPLEQLVLRR